MCNLYKFDIETYCNTHVTGTVLLPIISETAQFGGSLNALPLGPTDRQIFMEIRNVTGTTRVAVARRLGLSKATLSRSLSKLDAMGLVTEERKKPTSGQVGQPTIRITLRLDRVRVIGLNMSTQGCVAAVSDLSGSRIWHSHQQPLAANAAAITLQAIALVTDAMTVADVGSCDIGLFVPALFTPDGEIYEVTPNQSVIPFARIIAALRQEWPGSTVVPSGRADLLHHALEPEHFGQVLFHLSFADGIGGQIFDRDRPFRGGSNMSGNIGGMVPETGPRPSVTDLTHTLGMGPGLLSPDRIAGIHAAGDPRLRQWITDRATLLGPSISAVVQLINPEKLIIGGNLPQSVLAELAEQIDMSVYDVATRKPLRKPDISISNIIGEVARSFASASLPLARFAFASA
jgi:predicted NBD/HSP70 family sugar kinase